jgi:YHS domain-containing protein
MFFRIILYMVFAVVLISVLRTVIGVLMKGLGSLLSGQTGHSSPRAAAGQPPSPQLGGDLHRDPVCGTFVAETTAHQKRLSNQTFYYCSEECKEKHSLAAK